MKIFKFAELDAIQQESVCKEISRLESHYYGKQFSRSAEILSECFWKSPHTVCLALSFKKLVAACDFYSLTPDIYDAIRLGLVAEEKINANVVVTQTPETQSKNHWYMASIVSDPHSEQRGEAFKKIIRTAQRTIFGMSEKESTVLGVGSSEFGKKLLRDWGFEEVNADRSAIDLRPRFEKRLDHPKDIFSLEI